MKKTALPSPLCYSNCLKKSTVRDQFSNEIMNIFHMKEGYAAIPNYKHKSPTLEGSVNMAQCDSDWMRKMNERTCQAKWLEGLTKKHEKVVHISLQNQEVLLCIIKYIRKTTPCGYTQMVTRATFEEEICSNEEFATLEVPAFLKNDSIWECKWITRATFNEKTVALQNSAHQKFISALLSSLENQWIWACTDDPQTWPSIRKL